MAISCWRKSLVAVGLLGVLLTLATAAPVDDDPSPRNPPTNDENPANFPNQIEHNSPANVNSQELLTLDISEKQLNSNSQQAKLPSRHFEYDYEIPNGPLSESKERDLIASLLVEYANESPDAVIPDVTVLKRIHDHGKTAHFGKEAAAPPPPETTHSSRNLNLAQEKSKKALGVVTDNDKKEQTNALTSLEAEIGAGNPDCKYPGCLEQLAPPSLEDYVKRDLVHDLARESEWFRGEERGFENEYKKNEAFKIHPNNNEKDDRATEDLHPEEFFQQHDQFSPNKIGGFRKEQVFQGDKISDQVVPYLGNQRSYPPPPPPPPSLEVFFIDGDKYIKGESGPIPLVSNSYANSLNPFAPKSPAQRHYESKIELPSPSPSISKIAPPKHKARGNRKRPDPTWFQPSSEQNPVYELNFSNGIGKSNAVRAKVRPSVRFEALPGLPIDGMDDRIDEFYGVGPAAIIQTGSGSLEGQSLNPSQDSIFFRKVSPTLYFEEDK